MSRVSIVYRSLIQTAKIYLPHTMNVTDRILVLVVGYVSRTIAGIAFWICVTTCGVRIYGFRKALNAVRNGKLVIVANHPSLVEPVIFYAMLWPWSLIPRMAVWSMPDKRLLPERTQWLFKAWRCIAFSRENKHEAGKAKKRAVEVVVQGETLVIHPEGGRTYKGKEFVYSLDKERCLRQFKTKTHRIIRDAQARVLPVWINHMPGKWPFIAIYVGKIFDWYDFPDNDDEAREFLEQKILNAGEK